MSIQNNCRYGNVVWSIRLSAAMKSMIVSTVDELGAVGYRDGTRIGRNAQHLSKADSYWFHGSFPIGQTGVKFRITDTFQFTVKVGGKNLPGALFVDKTVRLA
ncbi:hypothetical protein [Demequina salsinemoris]|uniref:hypothetical protein n=1 Tax=Demequina salsinemoris TaxID=577470 RepID=UPI00128BCEFE|nr:hypothetical protein [Demequina salsinemoris]